MQFIGVIKRAVPFVITLAVGLFIASFFVSLAAPSFNGFRKNGESRWSKFRELKHENKRLRAENQRLLEQVGELEVRSYGHGSSCKKRKPKREDAFRSDLDRMVPPPAIKEMKMMSVPAN